MSITIRLYGRYKDTVGADTLTLPLTNPRTIQDVLVAFTTKYPDFTKDIPYMMATKNGALTSHDAPLAPGDKLAIAPPVVSGG